jgi:hypothetical protein
MAGKPITRAGVALLKERAEEVETLLEAGVSHTEVIESLGITRTAWREWKGSEAGAAIVARARASRAELLARETLKIADNVEERNDAVAKARLRIDTRKWISGAWDRETYGQAAPATNVQVNLGQLHLEALRAAGKPVIEGSATPAAEDEDDWLG